VRYAGPGVRLCHPRRAREAPGAGHAGVGLGDASIDGRCRDGAGHAAMGELRV